MYKQEQLEKDAKTAAQQMVYQIFTRTDRAKNFHDIAAVLEDESITRMRLAIREAYFKGLRDAQAIYQNRKDFEDFIKAIEKVKEDLT